MSSGGGGNSDGAGSNRKGYVDAIVPTVDPNADLPGLEDAGRNSGSVMSEMRALFTPPGRDSKRHQSYMDLQQPGHSFVLHPYYKRPGKGHNHDVCDACGEGGDLICCDQCPASFHFSCHSPPLEEDDIPMGEWVCLRCYVREKNRADAIKAANNLPVSAAPGFSAASAAALDASDGSGGGGGGNGGNGKMRGRPARGAAAKKQLEAVLKTEKEKAIKKYKLKYDKYLVVKPTTNSPFDALIAATQVSNAEQFKLPAELDPHEALPFSWKWSDERQDDLDSNNGPKVCAVCGKSTRGIPAIQCDFCPNIFHLDCLDPPLAEIPRDRWMCPNHVENFLDANLVTSTSLTERLKVWQKYARRPVDTETVRLEFFRKVRSGKLFQRGRVKRTPLDNRVKVPQFVKDHYCRPLPGYATDTPVAPMVTSKSDTDKNNEFIASLVSMQQSLAQLQTDAVKREIEEKAKLKARLKAKRRKERVQPKREEGREKVVENGIADRKEKKEEEEMDVDSDGTDSECSVNLDTLDDLEISAEAHAELNAYLVKSASAEDGLDLLSPVVRDFLALQKMKEVFDEARDSAAAAGLPDPTDPASEVQARAALVPLHVSKVPALMRYRTLEIGLGAGVGLDLSKYGHCNFVSARHASLYFDQYSQVYELINYSEHGTIVDNAIYALDCYSSTSPTEGSTPKSSSRARKAAKSAVQRWKTMSAECEPRECHCETSAAAMLRDSNGSGSNENSAVMRHGSYVRIGCFQFVFSIMDYLGGVEVKPEEKKNKKMDNKERATKSVTQRVVLKEFDDQ